VSHIRSADIRRLFDENLDKTWPGFRRALLQYKEGRAQGIDEPVIDELLSLTTRMERRNETFPISAELLERVVERETHQMPA
jgi:hypothetical protein